MTISESTKISILKSKLIRMAPRPFGEEIGEWLVKKLIPKISNRKEGSHDGILEKDIVEIKNARALFKQTKNLTLAEKLLTESERNFVVLKSSDDFLCNIQQIKPHLFDSLIYGIFFDDIILLFKITSEEILNDKKVGFVNKQHRGNEGEGQFHIKRSNLQYHIDNYLFTSLTYEDLKTLIENDGE